MCVHLKSGSWNESRHYTEIGKGSSICDMISLQHREQAKLPAIPFTFTWKRDGRDAGTPLTPTHTNTAILFSGCHRLCFFFKERRGGRGRGGKREGNREAFIAVLQCSTPEL